MAHSNVVRSSKTNKLQRQNAFDDTHPTANVQKPEKQQTDRNIIDFLNRCIPPPPDSTPPRSTDSDIYVDPIQISSRTLERLNSLYGLYKIKDSIGNKDEDEDEVVLRFREFQNFTPRSFRGSSKAMCSFASVLTFDHIFFWNACSHYLWFFFLSLERWRIFSVFNLSRRRRKRIYSVS